MENEDAQRGWGDRVNYELELRKIALSAQTLENMAGARELGAALPEKFSQVIGEVRPLVDSAYDTAKDIVQRYCGDGLRTLDDAKSRFDTAYTKLVEAVPQ